MFLYGWVRIDEWAQTPITNTRQGGEPLIAENLELFL
jgi:hypothetical protein